MLRVSVFLFAVIMLSSCSSEPYYEKDFYEKVTGIKFPKSAKAIESIDNGEFVTTTVFKVDSIELLEFINSYQLDNIRNQFSPRLLGNSYLKINRLGDSTYNGFYYKAGNLKKNSWLYLIDLRSKRLWAEIIYPDWADN